MTLTPLSGVEVVLGMFSSAEARLTDLRRLSLAIGVDEARVAALDNARLRAWLGVDESQEVARRSYATGARIEAGYHQCLAQLALVVIEFGRAGYADAYRLSKKLIEDDPLGVMNEALPNLIEAAFRSDHRGDATMALDGLRARARASGTPWPLGTLARCEAILASNADAESSFLKAISYADQTEVRTDRARTHLMYGEWLRRQKRRSDARTELRIAQDMFDDMGATAFAVRARSELAATGERNNANRDGLTPQEAQIARLASDGATNQEIATQLFISTHTVEYHLGKVYRKFGYSRNAVWLGGR